MLYFIPLTSQPIIQTDMVGHDMPTGQEAPDQQPHKSCKLLEYAHLRNDERMVKASLLPSVCRALQNAARTQTDKAWGLQAAANAL